jgi:hypothetical protein
MALYTEASANCQLVEEDMAAGGPAKKAQTVHF